MENEMEIEISKQFSFEASHILPRHPGRCSRLHGHSYKLMVYVKGIVNNDSGFVMDYAELKRVVQTVIDKLDHRHLGQWAFQDADKLVWELFHEAENREDIVHPWQVPSMPLDFYPSAENIVVWIADQLSDLDLLAVMKSRSLGPTTWGNSIKPIYTCKWSRLELHETENTQATLTREAYDAHKISMREENEQNEARVHDKV